jgi:hypothetical protein
MLTYNPTLLRYNLHNNILKGWGKKSGIILKYMLRLLDVQRTGQMAKLFLDLYIKLDMYLPEISKKPKFWFTTRVP